MDDQYYLVDRIGEVDGRKLPDAETIKVAWNSMSPGYFSTVGTPLLMGRDFKFRRRAILVGVILLVAADIALAAYSWNFASAPKPQQDLVVLTRNRDLLRADILRAQDIRSKIPAIQKDCDEFEKSLYPASTGYSAVSAELGIARSSLLRKLDLLGLRESRDEPDRRDEPEPREES